MKTGHIHVSTENIFPIIKKFLYSDHEIFLRELVSNAVDATQKLKFFAKQGEHTGDMEDLRVEVLLDKEAGTLTIRDRGIGMTAEEIDKYINQIAFSGAEEFVKQYEGKEGAESIIGHFGLGFYSAFMVADKVQIRTLARYKDAEAVEWESNGTTEFTIRPIEKSERGTDIVLHITEESAEFLEKQRIQGILDKYCKFLPVPVEFGTKTEYVDSQTEKDEDGKAKRVAVQVPNIVNNTSPAWMKAPVDLKDEDYRDFYRELYPMSFEEPLFHIHLNVDYPFNLTGILYFPRIKENVEVQRNKINLYSNQVFITDSVAEIVPEFLTLLHGVIDSPDIPLNVSRSYLQADGNVKKISTHITKKVADKLADMFKKDRADFEAKYDDLKLFVEYGMLSDEKFAEKAKSFALVKTTDGKYQTIEELKEAIAPLQTDKDEKLVVLYTHSKEEHFSFIRQAKDRGYQVAVIDGPLASHWISQIEQSNENMTFSRVDSDTLDQLIKKDGELPSKLSEEQQNELKPLFESAVDAQKFRIEFKSMSETDAPIIVTQPEFIRRMMEQQRMGGNSFFGAFPESYSMVVNANHAKIGALLEAKDDSEKSSKAKQLADLALLSQGLLKGEELSNFIERSIEFI
jgi:molecular chaperone HtpG